MIRTLVIEDEPRARRHLAEMLGGLPGVVVGGEAKNGLEGLAITWALGPDALFLDIRMPGMDGLGLMKILPEPRPAMVFVTAHRDHALDAFEGGALHYRLKPIGRVGVVQALSRIRPCQDPCKRNGCASLPE